jgi:hypothetical protein
MSRTERSEGMDPIPSLYKKQRSRRRKAKEKEAMRHEDYENIPKFRKSDRYDYF